MGLKLVFAQSTDVDTPGALAEVLASARSQLGGAVPGGALLFAGQDYDHASVLAGIADAWPGLPLIGCTTDGEVNSVQGYTEDSLLLVLFTGVTCTARLGDGLGVDADAAVQAVCEGPEGALAITLPASMTSNLGPVVTSLQERLGCPVVGGAAGDHRQFSLIRQFAGTTVYDDALPVLVLHGDVQVGVGVGCGWERVGGSYEVTRAEGNLLFELDGQPVLEVLANHAAMSRAELGEHPIAVTPPGASDFFLRPVFAVDAENGLLAFAAEVPVGSRVSLTRVMRDGVLDGAAQAARAAREANPTATAALVFTCAARKWLLGSRIEHEAAQLGQVGLPFAGFHGFAEIGPLGTATALHNQTCVVVALGAATVE